MLLAVFLVVDQFNVPDVPNLIGRLVRDDGNSGRLGTFKYRFEGFGVIRHNSDRTDFLGDEVFDRAHLLSRVGRGGSDHVSFNLLFFTGFFDALFHGGEPRNAADLDYDGNFAFRGTDMSA
jgi:hypothetical protein